MSEAVVSHFEPGSSPESAPDEFTLLRHWWKDFFNSRDLSETEFHFWSKRAIGYLNAAGGTFDRDLLFWGRALRMTYNGETNDFSVSPVFLDDRFPGISLGSSITRTTVEEGGNGEWDIQHTILYEQPVGNGFRQSIYSLSYDTRNFEIIEKVDTGMDELLARSAPDSASIHLWPKTRYISPTE
jgi:hypothetical protein